jgi:hypothetical protein
MLQFVNELTVQDTRERFTEGFESADLQEAKSLLEQFGLDRLAELRRHPAPSCLASGCTIP